MPIPAPRVHLPSSKDNMRFFFFCFSALFRFPDPSAPPPRGPPLSPFPLLPPRRGDHDKCSPGSVRTPPPGFASGRRPPCPWASRPSPILADRGASQGSLLNVDWGLRRLRSGWPRHGTRWRCLHKNRDDETVIKTVMMRPKEFESTVQSVRRFEHCYYSGSRRSSCRRFEPMLIRTNAPA